MTLRERFLKICHFELNDAVCLPTIFNWIWSITLERWHKEGLPQDTDINEFFEFEKSEIVSLKIGRETVMLPPFQERTLKKTAKWRIFIGVDGVKRKQFIKNGIYGMPQWIEFPVKDKKSWEKFKERLDPYHPARYPSDWEECKERWKNRDYPLGMGAGNFYGWLRDWIGMENLSLLFYDNPNLIKEMTEYLEWFAIEVTKKALNEVKFDFAYFPDEDLAFKTGPLLSPGHFKKFIFPHYVRIVERLRKYGIDIFIVDSDGNINEIIPLWLKAGVNGFLPLEAAAGMDVVKLRKKYAKNIILIGNIDKRVLCSKKAIEEEVYKKVPFSISQCGYFPAIDHSVPDNIPLENYIYYLSLLKKLNK